MCEKLNKTKINIFKLENSNLSEYKEILVKSNNYITFNYKNKKINRSILLILYQNMFT